MHAQPSFITCLGDACASNPCQNGGTCRVINGISYQCICAEGSTGINCEIREYYLTANKGRHKQILFETRLQAHEIYS